MPVQSVKVTALVFMALACGVGNVWGDSAPSSISLSVGYSSAYEMEDGWGIPSSGQAELAFQHPLSTHLFLVPSVGLGRYSGIPPHSIEDYWHVSVDVAPVGIGFEVKTDPTRQLVWRARESALLIYYRFRSEQFAFESNVPTREYRDELLLGLKVGGGLENRLGARGTLGFGIDYVLGEDIDWQGQGLSGIAKKGLRQFVPNLSVGWTW